MVSAPDTESSWPDLAGRLIRDGDGVHHVLPVRVYFEDTDFSGVVYHATYLRWCERGRSDFLRLLGNDHAELMKGVDGRPPGAFVVRRMQLEFLRPARIDDVLHVETRAGEIGAASITLHQRVVHAGRPIFEATVLVVLISLEGKPMRVGEALRAAFESGHS
jgi:acyl-CoA thioester hydrolase